MAILTNSYGDPAEVAIMVPRYNNGSNVFDASTRPTLLQVESFCDQVSAVLNAILAQNGFDVPVTDSDAVLMLDLFVNQEVAAIAEGVNSLGRFGPTQKQSGGKGRWTIMMDDAADFVEKMAHGIEAMGASRTENITIQFGDTDASGDPVTPLFQVEGFGYTRTNWDQADG